MSTICYSHKLISSALRTISTSPVLSSSQSSSLIIVPRLPPPVASCNSIIFLIRYTSSRHHQYTFHNNISQNKMCGSPNRTRNITSSSTTATTSSKEIEDIEDIHNNAIQNKSKTYTDPATGFTVFTEYAHLKRGRCCGNICRHCPYGWENVSYKDNGTLVRRKAKVQSGDKDGVRILLDQIENGEYGCWSSNEILSDCSKDDVNVKSEYKSTNNELMEYKEHDEKEKKDDEDVSSIDKNDDHNNRTNDESQNKSITNNIRGKGGRKGGTLTEKNVPYTRTGDEGTSMLLTGERRNKDDITFEAMGTVDELCSVVGVAHAELLSVTDNNIDYGRLNEWLLETMSRLFDVGSHIAKPKRKQSIHNDDDNEEEEEEEDDYGKTFTPDGIGGGFDEIHIHTLELWIDVMTEQLPELTSFVLPTGGKVSAQLHLARTVCRRAERRVLPLMREGVCDPNTVRYLNRLSDFFFTAARWTNFCEGKEEVQYRRFFKGAKQRAMVKVDLNDEKKFPH